MSVYTIVKRPLFLNNLNTNDHFENYAQQFTTESCTVESEAINKPVGLKNVYSNTNMCVSRRPPTQEFMKYKKKMNTRLMELNNCMSNMIQESICGIDSICNKVRNCISDMENSERNMFVKSSCATLSDDIVNENVAELAEYDIEEIKLTCPEHSVNENFKSLIDDSHDDDNTDFFYNANKITITGQNILEHFIHNETEAIYPFGKAHNKGDGILNKLKTYLNDIDDFDKVMDTFVEDINNKIQTLTNTNTRSRDKINVLVENIIEENTENKKINSKIEVNDKNVDTGAQFISGDFATETIKKVLSEQKLQTKKLKKNLTKKIVDSKQNTSLTDFSDDKSYSLKNQSINTSEPGELIPISPDVYRKKGTSDLNKKMIEQIEINDSFIGFQKLMEKCKLFMPEKEEESKKPEELEAKLLKPSECSLRKKHSLKIIEFVKNSKELKMVKESGTEKKSETAKEPGTAKDLRMAKESRTAKEWRTAKETKIIDLVKKYTDSLWFFQPKPNIKKTKKLKQKKTPNFRYNCSQKIQPKINKEKIRKIIKSSSSKKTIKGNSRERKSDISDKYNQQKKSNYKIEVKNCDPSPSSTKCRLHWINVQLAQQTRRKLDFCDILDDLTHRDLEPIHSEYPRKDNCGIGEKCFNIKESYLYKLMYGNQEMQDAWKNLLEPIDRIQIVPYDKKHEKNQHKHAVKQNKAKSEVVKKLLPHMTDPHREKYGQTFIVMPVRVFYDNYPIRSRDCLNEINPTVPPIVVLPLLPIKETKSNLKRAEWSSSVPKSSKVIYPPSKPIVTQNIQNHTVRLKPSYPLKIRNSQDQIQTSSSVKRKSINNDMLNYQFKNHQIKQMTNSERKLYGNKFNKSSAQKLVRFILNQEPQPEAFAPKAHSSSTTQYGREHKKVSVRKPVSRSLDREIRKLVPKGNGTKSTRSVGRFKKGPDVIRVKQNKKITNSSIDRQKIMLLHLQNLKNRNDVIQNNIQKAIDVIESKMIDILSAPADSSSAEAFNAMEKEITHVLTMMKEKEDELCQNKNEINSIINKNEGSENNINDELFLKMQYALEPEISKKTSTPIKMDSEEKEKTKYPYRSSTSSSSEEKFVITSSCEPSPKKQTKKENNTLTDENIKFKFHRNQFKKKISPVLRQKEAGDSQDKPTKKDFKCDSLQRISKGNRTITLQPEEMDSLYAMDTENHTIETNTIETISDNGLQDIIHDINDILVSYNANSDNNHSSDNEEKYDDCYSNRKAEVDEVFNSGEYDTEIVDAASEQIIKRKDCKVNYNDENNLNSLKKISKANDEKRVEKVEETAHCSSNYLTSEESPNHSLEKLIVVETKDELSWSEQLHRAITRVEDVYTELNNEDESSDKDSQLKSREIEDINSGMFYTPFMQVLRHVRSHPEETKKEKRGTIEKSPSCYNVLNFLDTLTNIHNERTVEVHTTKICYYARVVHQAVIDSDIKISQWVNYLCSSEIAEYPETGIPLKNIKTMLQESTAHNDDNLKARTRKVSFQLATKEQSNQVDFNMEKGTEMVNILYQELNSGIEGKYKLGSVLNGYKREKKLFHQKKFNADDENPTANDMVEAPRKNTTPKFKGSYSMKTINVVKNHLENLNPTITERNIMFLRLLKEVMKKPNLLQPIKHFSIQKKVQERKSRNKKNYNIAKCYESKVEEYELLLKSFYAIIFLLMFTAFNINIKCAF